MTVVLAADAVPDAASVVAAAVVAALHVAVSLACPRGYATLISRAYAIAAAEGLAARLVVGRSAAAVVEDC